MVWICIWMLSAPLKAHALVFYSQSCKLMAFRVWKLNYNYDIEEVTLVGDP